MLRAQISGVVTDADRNPLSGTAVELWAGDRQVAVQVTNSVGGFSFSATETRGVSGLLARHPGYHPARMLVIPPAIDLGVRLSVEPVVLEGVTARVEARRGCPNREAPAARAIWANAAERYSRALDSLGVGANFAWDERGVPSKEDVGPVPGRDLRRGAVEGYPAGRRQPWLTRLESSGYGSRITGTSPWSEFAAWYYPLEILPRHFVSPAFGALHTFSLIGQDGPEWVIGFCSRAGTLRGKVQLDGVLRVSMLDTLLSFVHYDFRSPAPIERAGGEIVYAPATAPDGRPLPLPATELFWRQQLGHSRLFQRYREYVGWELSRSDSSHVPTIKFHRGAQPPNRARPPS